MLSRFNFLYQNIQPKLQKSTLSKKNKERVFSIQKTFLFFKKIHLKNFFFFYSFKFLKRRHLRNFFNNFRKKNFLDLETFFANNFLRVLHRIFPFFNFFLLKKMVTRGLIFLNFKKVSHFFIQLRVGDFISIFFLNTLWSFFKKQVIKQSKHLFKVKAKIAAILKVKKNSSFKLASAHYSNNFKNLTVFFRKIPTWAEVDFLTFSFFIVKKNSLKSFFFFFNPYLYRLLEFK